MSFATRGSPIICIPRFIISSLMPMLLPFRPAPSACRRASLSAHDRRGNWEARSSEARLLLVQARLIAALAGFALATGCSPYVRRGEALYHEGRFIEAA